MHISIRTKKIKKIFSTLGIFSLLFFEVMPLAVNAASVSIPDSLINSVSTPATTPANGSSGNSGGSSNKQQAPQIAVNFSTTGTNTVGGKMTATAVPSFFNSISGTTPKLYFTWYLKHSGCDLSESAYPDGYRSCDREDSSGAKNTCESKLNSDRNDNQSNNTTLLSRCDLDGDGIITVNDWKIAAARIIVDGGFDSSTANYASSNNVGYDDSIAGYKASPSPYDDGSNNVWKMDSGADSNDIESPNCYVQEPSTGLIYEMRRVDPQIEPCPKNYSLACAVDGQSDTCPILNPLYDPVAAAAANAAANQANADNANITAANAAAAAWNADPANHSSPLFPKVDNTPLENVPPGYGILKTGTPVVTATFCKAVPATTSDIYCKIDSTGNNSQVNLTNFQASVSCNNGGTPMCVRSDGSNTSVPASPSADNPAIGIVFGASNGLCSSLTPNPSGDPAWLSGSGYIYLPGATSTTPTSYSNPDAAYADVAGQTCAEARDAIISGDADNTGNSKANQTCTFIKSDNMCEHIFPVVPGNVNGDGHFSLAEKKFWGADPTKSSTSGTGTDEANAVGLGVDKFTWTYSDGDQVGVAVEGDSTLPTLHADSTYRRMWAFSNNTCSAMSSLNSSNNLATGQGGASNVGKRGFYLEGNGGGDCDMSNEASCVGILTAEFDVNNCLEENLLDPQSSTSKLSVQLSASPDNPINDPNGNGDTLTVTSAPANLQDPDGLLYTWSVEESKDGSLSPIDSTSWKDITSDMESAGSFAASDAAGIGKKTLAVNLNLQDAAIKKWLTNQSSFTGVFYLRVKLGIVGGPANGNQDAAGSVVVRVSDQLNTMTVYPVNAASDGTLSLNKNTKLCVDASGNQESPCYASLNELVGITIPANAKSSTTPFTWMVNGNPISCDATMSTDCAHGNTLIFPIMGNAGETVNVDAKGLDNTGQPIEVSQNFVIGPAQLQIVSADNKGVCSQQCLDNNSTDPNIACPKYLGQYMNLGSSPSPDCSVNIWQTNVGKTVTLQAAGSNETGLEWTIDGQEMPEFSNQNQIQLVIDKSVGDSYSIGVSTNIAQGDTTALNNVRIALNKYWGIAPTDDTQEDQTANIQLDVVNSSSAALSQANSSSLSASLITHLPQEFMFLFKIALTAFTLLLSMGLLFAFIPDSLFEKS